MSECDVSQVEAYLQDELAAPPADDVAAHLAACVGCARELAALRAERAAFSARSRRGSDVAPPFEAVLRASRAPRPRWAARAVPAWIAAGVSVAAAVVVLLNAGPRSVDGNGGACFLADGEGVESAELAEASEDSRFGQCLLASPAPRNRCF